MIRRALGCLMLIAVILPILLGCGGFLLVLTLSDAISIAANTRQAALTPQIEIVDRQIADARQSLGDAEVLTNALLTELPTVRANIDSISPTVDLGTPDTAAITLPAIETLRQQLRNIVDVLEDQATALSNIADLRLAADQMQVVYNEINGFYNDLNAIIAANSGLVSVLCIGGLIWLLILYIAFLGDWLSRGWAYLTGAE